MEEEFLGERPGEREAGDLGPREKSQAADEERGAALGAEAQDRSAIWALDLDLLERSKAAEETNRSRRGYAGGVRLEEATFVEVST